MEKGCSVRGVLKLEGDAMMFPREQLSPPSAAAPGTGATACPGVCAVTCMFRCADRSQDAYTLMLEALHPDAHRILTPRITMYITHQIKSRCMRHNTVGSAPTGAGGRREPMDRPHPPVGNGACASDAPCGWREAHAAHRGVRPAPVPHCGP